MDPNVLIDAVVRQTTVLLAHLATATGGRATLAHTANQIFVNLVHELRAQGLGNKVIADMFGVALRTYHEKVRRLSESTTVRGKSLWASPKLRSPSSARKRRHDVRRGRRHPRLLGLRHPGQSRAHLTVGEGVTATANQIGMSVAGHVTVSVPIGHRTTSFSGNQFANMPPPPSGGWGIFVSGSIVISGVPSATLGTGTVVVNGNDGSGVYIDQRGVAAPRQIVVDGLVAYGNGVPPSAGGYAYSGIVIGGGSNVRLRNSVVLGNGTAGVEVRTMTTFDNRRLNDLTKIDLGTGDLGDGGSDYGHNVVQALPGQGANGGVGICLFVDPNTGTLNAAGNVFAGPRDCAAASPGALTFANVCGVYADLGIVTLTDGGFIMDGGGTLRNDINASNCTR